MRKSISSQRGRKMTDTSPAPKSVFDVAVERLRMRGYKLTRARADILRLVLEQSKPFTFTSITEIIVNTHKGCDPATVYRSLPILEAVGLIERCAFGHDRAFYELKIGHEIRYRMVCRNCYKIDYFESLERVNIRPDEHQRQFLDLLPVLEYHGICMACDALNEI